MNHFGPLDTILPTYLPTYYGHKEELTDENGIFDVEKAGRLVGGEEVDASHESLNFRESLV